MPILDAMMNSSRARPTPFTGRNDCSKAMSGEAIFTIIFVFVSGSAPMECSRTEIFDLPVVMIPALPVVSTVYESAGLEHFSRITGADNCRQAELGRQWRRGSCAHRGR